MVPRSVRFGAEVKQHCSVIRWVTKNLSFRDSPCFGRHVKLVPAAFAVNIHQPALSVVGYSPFSLCVIHKACAPAVGTLMS
jgi:hypothetical protein